MQSTISKKLKAKRERESKKPKTRNKRRQTESNKQETKAKAKSRSKKQKATGGKQQAGSKKHEARNLRQKAKSNKQKPESKQKRRKQKKIQNNPLKLGLLGDQAVSACRTYSTSGSAAALHQGQRQARKSVEQVQHLAKRQQGMMTHSVMKAQLAHQMFK